MIQITDLSKTYRSKKKVSRALDGVFLDIEAGEVFGLIGPNGAGKTTLMQCMLGLIRPSAGKILIRGLSPNHIDIKRILAFLPERPLFDAWMTARQFLSYHHMLTGQKSAHMRADVEAALERVELDEQARSRKIKTYSKGMLQRLGLAQMLIGRPSLCFLDEPTSGLDPVSRNIVRNLILKWKEEGATVVINSHHLDEVERVCDRVAFIQGGKIELVERTRQIADSRVCMILHWCGPENAEERLKEVAEQADFGLELTGDRSARFILRARPEIPVLVRGLVNAQVDIEELFIERANLERLFSAADATPSSIDGGARADE